MGSDILHQNVYAILSKKNVVESILTLNHDAYYNYFIPMHQYEIDIIKKIESIIKSNQINPTKLLSNLTRCVQLSEFYALKLPSLLNEIASRPFPNDILQSMHIGTIRYRQYKAMSFDGFPLELILLVLSSRSLAARSFPIHRLILKGNYTGTFSKYLWAAYPWIAFPDSLDTIYFGYLYQFLFEVHHKYLSIPTLDGLYLNKNTPQRSNILYLIDKKGFIPWHRNTLQYFRKQSPALTNYRDILEIMRINDLLFNIGGLFNTMRQGLSNDVMTYIFLHEFKNITVIELDSDNHQSQKETLAIIQMLIRYNNNNTQLMSIKSRMFEDTHYII